MKSIATLLRRLTDAYLTRPLAFLAFLAGIILMLISIDGLVPGLKWTDHVLQNCAAIGTALTFIAGTAVFFFPGHGKSAVGYLLVEHAELSLGRTQVFLWLIPAVAIYGGMVLPHLTLVAFPPALMPILGGSLGTAVLGAATAPSADAIAAVTGQQPQTTSTTQTAQTTSTPTTTAETTTTSTTTPDTTADSTANAVVDFVAQRMTLTDDQKSQLHDAVLKDVAASAAAVATPALATAKEPATRQPSLRLLSLVEDFKGQGDITRYQFLFLTALGSLLLLAGYLRSGVVPQSIPQDLLYLMGGSALGYLGTKTVKTIALENEAARKQ